MTENIPENTYSQFPRENAVSEPLSGKSPLCSPQSHTKHDVPPENPVELEDDIALPDAHRPCPPSARSPKILGVSQAQAKYIFNLDITNGLELYPIRVWNSMTKEQLPHFEYIKTVECLPKYSRTPLACECIGGCDDHCRCMSDPYAEGVNEIPYNETTGNLKAIPKKWLRSHRVLWECSELCPCGPECPSRSAQLGLRYQMEIFMTAKKGWGVRARRNIPKGAFIAEYAGVMSAAKEDEIFSESNWYSFDIMSEMGQTNFFIDAMAKGNVARFFNHSCEPNMIAIHVFYDDNNPALGMHICFFACKPIADSEEFTFDYGEDYWNAKVKKGKGCECGSVGCNYRVAKKRKAIRKC